MSRLKATWTVNAGILIGEPIAEHCRQWTLTSDDWDGKSPERRAIAFRERATLAMLHAEQLQDPRTLNWVTLEFLWI